MNPRRSAVRWGCRKARLLPHDVLDGITYPKYESKGEAYSTEELDAISAVAAQVDPRFAGVWEIVCSTGRRVSAIRTLRVEDLNEIDGIFAINFPAKTDKARKRGRVFIVHARPAIDALLERPEVQASGWLFPRGRLDCDDDYDGPLGESALLTMLRKAEKLAGVEYVPGRGFHGAKRRFVTQLMNETGGDADAVGLITGNIEPSILQRVYRQHEDELRLELAKKIARAREATHTDSTQES